jgi:sulfatase maturation enzyme AslB (radical SAM superfamily)
LPLSSRVKDVYLRTRARFEPGFLRAYSRWSNTRGRRAYLNQLNLEFTSICNLRCKWCSLDHQGNRGMMTMDLLRRVLEEVEDRARFRIDRLELHNGGETMLHPEFGEFLEEIARSKRRGAAFRTVNLLTNATKLEGEKMDAIFETGAVDWMRFSVDGGTRETFEDIRVRAEYERVMSNIERFLDENERRSKPIRTGLISILADPAVEPDRRFVELTRRVTNYMPRPAHNWDGSVELGIPRAERPPRGLCMFVMIQLVVLWSGKVSPCCNDLNGRGPIGDLAEESLFDIARGEERRRMWRLMKAGRRADIPLCRGCDMPK